MRVPKHTRVRFYDLLRFAQERRRNGTFPTCGNCKHRSADGTERRRLVDEVHEVHTATHARTWMAACHGQRHEMTVEFGCIPTEEEISLAAQNLYFFEHELERAS